MYYLGWTLFVAFMVKIGVCLDLMRDYEDDAGELLLRGVGSGLIAYYIYQTLGMW